MCIYEGACFSPFYRLFSKTRGAAALEDGKMRRAFRCPETPCHHAVQFMALARAAL
jgi:hypothetical protein